MSARRPAAYSWLLALALLTPIPSHAQRLRLDSLIRRDTLPNGLTVLVLENHNVPLATAHIVFRGGAMMQTPELQGIPHLFEHMLFKSYTGSDGQDFGRAASEARASYNGATGDEEVSYTLWFPSKERDANIELLANLVRDPRFENKALQTERFVVRNEMARGESEPTRLLRDASLRALWGSWYHRKNTIGDAMSLLGAQLATLKSIYDTWYVPNNAALVVTGDVNATDVMNAARKHFGRWRRQADPMKAAAIPSPPPLDSSFAFVLTHEVQTVTVRMSWRGPTLRNDRNDALDVAALTSMLDADNSRFQRALTDNGAFQRVSVGADLNAIATEITFVGTTTTDRLTDALGVLGIELGQLAQPSYFDRADFTAAVQHERVDRALALEQTATFASYIGSAWAVGWLNADAVRAQVAAADSAGTAADAARLGAVAAKYLVRKPYVIGVLTPAGTQDVAAAKLSQFVDFLKEP
jgi:zinc protease